MIEQDLQKSLEAAKRKLDASAVALDATQKQHQEDKLKYERLQKAVAVLNGSEPATPQTAAGPQATGTLVASPPAPLPPRRNLGPYAGIACGACNEVGTLNEQFRNTQNGGVARMLVCSDCGNERYLG